MTAPQIVLLVVLTNVVCVLLYKTVESIRIANENARRREAEKMRKLGEDLGKDFMQYVLGTGRHARR
jgi:hypothetical protein